MLIALGAGGGVLLLVVFLGFIWPGFFVSGDGGKVAKGAAKKFTPQKVSAPVQEAVDLFTLIPDNCEFVAGGSGNPQRLASLMQMSGMTPEQVRLFSSSGKVFIAGSIPAAGPLGPINIIQAFTSNVPLDAQKVQEAFKAEGPQIVQGKSIYKIKSPGNPRVELLTLPNDQTLIMSPMPEPEFVKVLEGQGKLPAELREQTSALKDKTLWGVMNLQALLRKNLFDLNALAMVPGGAEVVPAIKNAKLASFFAEFDKRFHVQIDLHCANDQDAALVENFAQKAWNEMGKPQVESIGPMLSMAGVGADPVKALIEDITNAVKIQKQGPIVTASLTFSEGSFNALKSSTNPSPKAPTKAKAKKK